MLKFGRKNYENGLKFPRRRTGWRFWLPLGLAAIALLVGVFGLVFWHELGPRDKVSDNVSSLVEVNQGDSIDTVVDRLNTASLIRSTWAFKLYARLHDLRSDLKPGRYMINSSQSVSSIVDKLASGKSDEFRLTIVGGLTLDQIEYQLVHKYGYRSSEVKAAFEADYSSPLLASKPASATLEGYIFPETFNVLSSESLEHVLSRDFAVFYGRIKEGKLVDKFERHNLTLYQALTLASIVQREASKPANQKKVAQVFLKRLKSGQPLGSDVTAIYGARQDGVISSTDNSARAAAVAVKHDSPYNTRINKGLPPGPIANVEFSALEAVADPAKTNYTYFIGGDDRKMHFASSLKQHNRNIAKYCQTSCR